MILIINSITDTSSLHVVLWIRYLSSYNCVILNEHNYIKEVFANIRNNYRDKIILESSTGEIINFDKLHSIWYRRGPIKVSNSNTFNITSLNRILNDENNCINEFLFHEARSKDIFFLGNYYPLFNSINKLSVLHKANEVGLRIPDSYLINSKKSTKKIKQDSFFITKNISNSRLQTEKTKSHYKTLTFEIDLKKLPSDFYPSLIQNKINKKYELRIFYLCGKFYSSAIFSQSLDQTSVDYRNYNYKIQNRIVPYLLPNLIQDKLSELISFFKLNTCSIDMIVTNKDEYVFLEINPAGQFGNISKLCNYQLEKSIANLLINEKNEEKK